MGAPRAFFFLFVSLVACAGGSSDNGEDPLFGAQGGAGGGAGAGGVAPGGAGGEAGSGGSLGLAGDTGVGGKLGGDDPNSCEGAAALKSYVGCDYWPTVTANAVWSTFDFAVIAVNSGDVAADVEVSQGSKVIATETIEPNSLKKIFLPWVPALKGPDADECGSVPPAEFGTVGALQAAYHLVSTRPVSVYQFNALEYKGEGGPDGKSWATCPGNGLCTPDILTPPTSIGCFSFSNDASLLLPTSALTGNYRISAPKGRAPIPPDFLSPGSPGSGAFFAVTATEDGTTVKIKLSDTAKTMAGAGIGATGPGEVVSFAINRGDVLQLRSEPGYNLSGSLVQADKPVQVIAGHPCANMPDDQTPACDHLEESVLPAETLGKHYLVAPPTGPKGNVPGHVVQLLGNVDGTQLTYKGKKPVKAPDTINAGEVVDLGKLVGSFEIEGDHEFIVTTFMLGGGVLDPPPSKTTPYESKGDPSMSVATAIEQFRLKYVFLAPDDYDISYADVLAPVGATLTLDGEAVSVEPKEITDTDYQIFRILLGPGQNGAHILEADQPVGLQVMGYGSFTSYQYPGGSNLTLIAPPPPDID